MKKNLFLLLIVFFIVSASQAVAYEYDYGVSVGDKVLWDNQYVGNGGEFGMTVVDSTEDNFDFTWSTFCVEYDQHMAWAPNTMTVSDISSANTLGAALTDDVAWLYWNFSQDTLTGYDGSKADQSDLQQIIWLSMGQISSATYNDQAQVDTWLGLAADDYADGWNNDYGLVQVLNLGNNQDLLVAATNPVPEPASMVLLGVGLIGLVAVGRKKAKRN